jgi:hypothetical protein
MSNPIPMPESVTKTMIEVLMNNESLYPTSDSDGERVSAVSIFKEAISKAKSSGQGASPGVKDHPFDRSRVAYLQTINEHHATCIHTKVASTVGLGFLTEQDRAKRTALGEATMEAIKPPKPGEKPPVPAEGPKPIQKAFPAPQPAPMSGPQVGQKPSNYTQATTDELLNPLCRFSFADVLNDVVEDFWQVGDGAIEVIRKGDEIVGLYHIASQHLNVEVETKEQAEKGESGHYYHYKFVGGEEGSEKIFAIFGDKEDMLKRLESQEDPDSVSEVICFRKPSSLSRWYGFADWVAATAAIELVQCLRQQKYDFFNNRGVPEFILFVLGTTLSETQWTSIENSMKATIGSGNAHKSIALNITNPEAKIQLEKLALEGKQSDDFTGMADSLALSIVTAHRVPPLLAGIQVPGKLGATNELPNALKAFQLLVIGPAQRIIHQTLSSTLGNAELNGGLALTPDNFELKTITDEIDLGAMDTMSRMRQTLPEAQAEGRDLNAGVKD